MNAASDSVNFNLKLQRRDLDVIVAGGGPAGSTAAALLAQYGHRVLLIERDCHPRFHIGESMLPCSEPVMERLGIDWSQGNLFKPGAEFVDETQGRRMFFPLSGTHKTYQVERATFDHRLLLNAGEKGADVRQEERVTEVCLGERGVAVQTEKGAYDGRYFIDATGRNALMGRRHRGIERIDNLGRFALYAHFGNVTATASDRLFETGNIIILTVDLGWIWIIPLVDRRLSVGLVVQKARPKGLDNESLFAKYRQASPLLTAALEGTEPETPVKAEADFSFVNCHRYGRRYACCGDAAGFLDPVFSSGVFLALTGSARIADRLHGALLEKREDDPRLHSEDDQNYRLGFRTMQLIVERFYHSDLVHNLFFEADRDPKIKDEIARILAGDLWSGDNLFQQGMLQGRRNR